MNPTDVGMLQTIRPRPVRYDDPSPGLRATVVTDAPIFF